MKEVSKYTVNKETVTRTQKLPDGKKIAIIYRGRDFGGDSLEKFRLDRTQEADGVPQEQRVTLPKRQQGS